MDISSIKVENESNSKFWVLMVDNSTRFMKTFFLKRKSELYDKMRFALREIERENKKVKMIRCDNAGENRKLKEILDLEGFNIKFEFTAPYTPRQNGVVERAFATLYGRVRAMINGAGLEKRLREYLWAECTSTATMLQNSLSIRRARKVLMNNTTEGRTRSFII